MSLFPKSSRGPCRCKCHQFKGHFHCFKPDCCSKAGVIFDNRPSTPQPARTRMRFHLQGTKTFPDGAPQRESYNSDNDFELECMRYRFEWCAQYECPGCDNSDCPQCGG